MPSPLSTLYFSCPVRIVLRDLFNIQVSVDLPYEVKCSEKTSFGTTSPTPEPGVEFQTVPTSLESASWLSILRHNFPSQFAASTVSMSSPKENDVEIGAGTDSGKNFSRNESTLDSHDDPFAPREGKTLTWRNVNMTLVCRGAGKVGSDCLPLTEYDV